MTGSSLNPPNIALLSVAGTDDGSNLAGITSDPPPARQELAGGSLIEYQISTLARAGVTRFVIEVEDVTGSLIALAHKCRGKDLTVDFARTGKDILRYIEVGDRIWVQSSQLYVQFPLIETLIRSNDNFVGTVDSRDENTAFERIDLNTRWSGISVVNYDTMTTLRDLPEDWSVISSLLRQAILAKIPFRPLSQQHVDNGTVTILSGPRDFSELNRQILRRRVASRSGFVEAQLFGPILSRIVPVIWQSRPATVVTKFAAPLAAFIAASLGIGGFATAACALAFCALAANSLQLAVADDADGDSNIEIWSAVFWTLMVVAAFGTAYVQPSYHDSGLFAAFAVLALGFLTHKMLLPALAKQLLHSPAALTLLAGVGSALFGFAIALQWIMVLQLGTLILVTLGNDLSNKKKKQA